MERRTFVPTLGFLAAALASIWISPQASAGQPQASAGHPFGIREDGSANIDMLNQSAEARVTVVPKTVGSKRTDGSPQGPLGVGFGRTAAPLEPLPLSGEHIPRLMIMATPSPLAAARPAPSIAVPRTVTPKAKPKPAAQEPQERLSWLRLPWWRR